MLTMAPEYMSSSTIRLTKASEAKAVLVRGERLSQQVPRWPGMFVNSVVVAVLLEERLTMAVPKVTSATRRLWLLGMLRVLNMKTVPFGVESDGVEDMVPLTTG